LAEVKTSSGPGYKLTVESVLKTNSRYFDTIYIETDSNLKPEIIIKVNTKTILKNDEKFKSSKKNKNVKKKPKKKTEKKAGYKIYFKPNSPEVQEVYIPLLKKMAERLKLDIYQSKRMLIQGHTDDQGSKEKNHRISLARATKVRNILVERFGIEKKRLVIEGKGASMSVASNKTEAGRAKNRRVNFFIHEKRYEERSSLKQKTK
jgi:outer membrane protein OmpA-like peptidoglycan-associated protein